MKKKSDCKPLKKEKRLKLNIRDHLIDSDKIDNLHSAPVETTINESPSSIQFFSSNDMKIMQDFGQINNKNAEKFVSRYFFLYT